MKRPLSEQDPKKITCTQIKNFARTPELLATVPYLFVYWVLDDLLPICKPPSISAAQATANINKVYDFTNALLAYQAEGPNVEDPFGALSIVLDLFAKKMTEDKKPLSDWTKFIQDHPEMIDDWLVELEENAALEAVNLYLGEDELEDDGPLTEQDAYDMLQTNIEDYL